jgi:hypothetical protein
MNILFYLGIMLVSIIFAGKIISLFIAAIISGASILLIIFMGVCSAIFVVLIFKMLQACIRLIKWEMR